MCAKRRLENVVEKQAQARQRLYQVGNTIGFFTDHAGLNFSDLQGDAGWDQARLSDVSSPLGHCIQEGEWRCPGALPLQ